MQVRHILAAVVAVPVLGVLVACQPAPESPTASPTSPTSTVPTTASQSTPSHEELFREASEVYRRIRLEVDKLEAAGGAKELPASLKQYVTGELEANLSALYVDLWPKDHKKRIGEARIIWVGKSQLQLPSGAVTATSACVDASGAEIRYPDGTFNKGIIQTQIFFYGHFDGRLKAFASHSEKVTTC